MIRQLVRIVARFVGTVFVSSILIFLALRVVPGDPAEIALGVNATPELLAKKRAELGTDRPLIVQYWDWFSSLITGDFGVSMSSSQNISPIIADRFQVSLILVVTALILAVAIAVPLGMWAALRARHVDGILITAGSQVGIAIPSFLAAILLVTVFAVHLGWLPANGWIPPGWDFGSFLSRLILPVLSLAAVQAAIITRYVRNSVLDILHDDFLRTARAKGQTRWQALLSDGLRNAALPVITVTGVQLAGLVVGAVVIERVFSIPGLGAFLLDSVSNRDLPAVQAAVLVLVVFTLAINTLVDLSYAIIDPRVRRVRA
ncbi:ABC transporter permease [Corynebacterium pyruviciproducens]|uniref:ABC transmembrane type-1 domain-containing protein n=2 Tax=Corynebacterium pyruviciproducens TaxID=598660 RepID=S2Z6D6_9CORY|nr:ABC transporter permease [Corynebacterium pyruviciproducens]EPD69775.1 hypothetical protein HMPREF1219_01107 [Corynebacterium pyruviciproducens ATCC BAA-1742]MDH4657779.1 ABC transporter permease [Corynebacterium pyruviciproducens]MDK6565203.1 ABC transporter permease [Corynebacterium pyruviciproducens]MDK7214160.1 ABC transporter permease [Corynebacterium pyruviciproducens]WOT02826.1 ABC transporter permease [Corynebacterium pyruviciproducens]